MESSRYEFTEDETPKERFERIQEQIGAILKRVKEEKVVAIWRRKMSQYLSRR